MCELPMVVNTVLSILECNQGVYSSFSRAEVREEQGLRWGEGLADGSRLGPGRSCQLKVGGWGTQKGLQLWSIDVSNVLHVYVCVMCVHVFARVFIHTHVDARAWQLVSLSILLYFIPWGKDSAEARVPKCGLQGGCHTCLVYTGSRGLNSWLHTCVAHVLYSLS